MYNTHRDVVSHVVRLLKTNEREVVDRPIELWIVALKNQTPI